MAGVSQKYFNSSSGNTVKKYTITGNGAATAFNILHSLGNTDYVIQVKEKASGRRHYPEFSDVDTSNLTVTFPAAVANNFQYDVLIIGKQTTSSGVGLPSGALDAGGGFGLDAGGGDVLLA